MYVVKGQGDTALLSRGPAVHMGLVEYHLDLTTSTPLPIMGETQQVTTDLVKEYNDVFSGLGKLSGVKVKLHVNPDAKGTVQKYLCHSKTNLMIFWTSGSKWIS